MSKDPRREPVPEDVDHLINHIPARERRQAFADHTCCWDDEQGFWRIDMVDGLAVTWCNSPRQEKPF